MAIEMVDLPIGKRWFSICQRLPEGFHAFARGIFDDKPTIFWVPHYKPSIYRGTPHDYGGFRQEQELPLREWVKHIEDQADSASEKDMFLFSNLAENGKQYFGCLYMFYIFLIVTNRVF